MGKLGKAIGNNVASQSTRLRTTLWSWTSGLPRLPQIARQDQLKPQSTFHSSSPYLSVFTIHRQSMLLSICVYVLIETLDSLAQGREVTLMLAI